MCIIAYKPKGIQAPSKNILQTCFDNNPDGAGLLLIRKDSNIINIYKGFFSFDSFYQVVKSLNIGTDDISVYHFRIATSGLIDSGNCHPFPISNIVKDLTATYIETDKAFVHNGVIGKGKGKLSDTMVYVKDKLFPMRHSLSTKKAQKKIEKDTVGSRTITIDTATNTILLTGEWIDNDGILYSNSTYRKRESCFSKKWDSYYTEKGNAESNVEDSALCPMCFERSDIISYTHGLLECPNCSTVFTREKEIILEGLLSGFADYDNF